MDSEQKKKYGIMNGDDSLSQQESEQTTDVQPWRDRKSVV